MWDDLQDEKKQEYKRMILALASVTEIFAQKFNDQKDNECQSDKLKSDNEKSKAKGKKKSDQEKQTLPAPIINSKYQETVFQKAFGAKNEDIGNTAYDVSLKDKNTGHIYLIGIKTFGVDSGHQKIAQFKANDSEISELFNQIKKNDGETKKTPENSANKNNNELYLKIAKRIAELRNDRIRSDRAKILGLDSENKAIESVYHVLMPSKKGEPLQVHVGETEYEEIDEKSIIIDNCNKSLNFHDSKHAYRFTKADSQLLMDFKNREIIIESWDVIFADDAYDIFAEIYNKVYNKKVTCPETAEKEKRETIGQETETAETESYIFPLKDKNGRPKPYSGLNSFFGLGLKKAKAERETAVKTIHKAFKNTVSKSDLKRIVDNLKNYVLMEARSNQAKAEKANLRSHIMEQAQETKNQELVEQIRKLIFRPMEEVYIPILNAREFHEAHPDFFAPGLGRLIVRESGKIKKIPKEQREFNLMLEPSGDILRAYITQDSGKGIESVGRQSDLGNWLLRGVFQLDEYEPLTSQKLDELGINAFRLYRVSDDDCVHLEFIWADDENEK